MIVEKRIKLYLISRAHVVDGGSQRPIECCKMRHTEHHHHMVAQIERREHVFKTLCPHAFSSIFSELSLIAT